jgi:hypothetical protein
MMEPSTYSLKSWWDPPLGAQVGAGGGGFVPVARSLQPQAHRTVSVPHTASVSWGGSDRRERAPTRRKAAKRAAGVAPTRTSPALLAGLGLPVGPVEPGLHAIAAILFVMIEPLRPAVCRVRCTVCTPAPCQSPRGVAAGVTCSCRPQPVSVGQPGRETHTNVGRAGPRTRTELAYTPCSLCCHVHRVTSLTCAKRWQHT